MIDVSSKPGLILHLHAFRGFAIFNIVGAHAWSYLVYLSRTPDLSGGLDWVSSITESIFNGSTLYFVIISGILYSRVLSDKSFADFYKSKLLNVVLPYTLLSLVFTALFWQFYLENTPEKELEKNFLVAYLKNLFTGKAQMHFWYVPIFLGLAILTPGYYYWVTHKYWRWFAIAIVLLPLVVSRSGYPDFLSLESYVYFSGAYVLGMFIGQYYKIALNIFHQYQLRILCFAIISTLVVVTLFYTRYQIAEWFSISQSAVYIQKIAITCWVIHYLSAHEARLPNWLMVLGTYAFSIYFLHSIAVHFGSQEIYAQIKDINSIALVVGGGVVIFATGILLSLLISKVIHALTGKYSRMLIGS